MAITRRRAYLMLLLGALVGGGCGAAFDQVTVTISPEYFLDGKGLRTAPDALRAAVAWTGFRAGLPFGALIAGVGILLARRSSAFSWHTWIVRIAMPFSIALLACPVLMFSMDPFDVRRESTGVWTRAVADRYLVCWGLHVGAYVGVVAGLVRAAWRDRGRSRQD